MHNFLQKERIQIRDEKYRLDRFDPNYIIQLSERSLPWTASHVNHKQYG